MEYLRFFVKRAKTTVSNRILTAGTECLQLTPPPPLLLICGSLNLPCDGIWRWGHWEIIRFKWGHEGRTLMMGLVSLKEKKEGPYVSTLLPHPGPRHNVMLKEVAVCKPGLFPC